MITVNTQGLQLEKVRVMCVRGPGIGEKFSSRHGKKDMIGRTITQEDLPCTVKSITPDFFINPISVPSRMIIDQLIESILGKVARQEEWKMM